MQVSTMKKICPVCGKVFNGRGWTGMDAHWRSGELIEWQGRKVRHEEIESYEDAKKAGLLEGLWRPPEERRGIMTVNKIDKTRIFEFLSRSGHTWPVQEIHLSSDENNPEKQLLVLCCEEDVRHGSTTVFSFELDRNGLIQWLRQELRELDPPTDDRILEALQSLCDRS